MKTLNITKGKWKSWKDIHDKSTPIIGTIKGASLFIASRSSKTSPYDYDGNVKLIIDAANTYNNTPILPSELLKQRNELLEALERAQKIIEHVINITPTSEQRNLYTHANIIALTAIKNATNA